MNSFFVVKNEVLFEFVGYKDESLIFLANIFIVINNLFDRDFKIKGLFPNLKVIIVNPIIIQKVI